jgi:hypothetical protein
MLLQVSKPLLAQNKQETSSDHLAEMCPSSSQSLSLHVCLSVCLSGLVESGFQSHAIFACRLPRLVHEAEAKAPEFHSFKDLQNSCSENSFFKEFLILEP